MSNYLLFYLPFLLAVCGGGKRDFMKITSKTFEACVLGHKISFFFLLCEHKLSFIQNKQHLLLFLKVRYCLSNSKMLELQKKLKQIDFQFFGHLIQSPPCSLPLL